MFSNCQYVDLKGNRFSSHSYLEMKGLNKYNLRILSSVLFVPLFVEAFTVFRHGPNSIITAIIYMGVLALSLIKIHQQIKGKDICILFGIYAFIVMNIVLFPSTFDRYKSIIMVLSLIFYLPIGCFVIRHIKNWNELFNEIKPFAIGSVFLGIYIVFFGNVGFNEEYFNYMEFSYCILPFVSALFVIARKSQKNKILWWCLFFTDATCMIMYGARATILFLVILIVTYEYFGAAPKTKIFVILGIIVIAGLITIYFDDIILYLSDIDGLKDSRLIAKAVAGKLADGGERDILIQDSIERIKSMDLEISGIFGDRAYIRGIYPHNIGLEILMQFGYFLGGSVMLFMLYMITANMTRTKYGIVSMYLTCVLFGRFLFSGSYIQDGCFWIWLFCMLNIFSSRKRWLSAKLQKVIIMQNKKPVSQEKLYID